MKLDEFRVANERVQPGRPGYCLAAIAGRIRGRRVQPADAAGGDNGGAGGDFAPGAAAILRQHAAAAAITARQQPAPEPAFADLDMGRGPGRGGQGFDDGLTGQVAVDAGHACPRMRGFPGQCPASVGVVVEGDAERLQRAHLVGAGLGQQPGGGFVRKPGAGGNGVGGVQLRTVVGAQRRGDAALGPAGGRITAQRVAGQQNHRQRRGVERSPKAGDA